MKYSIELTKDGKVKETFSFYNEKFGEQAFECNYERTDCGCIQLDEPISKQMKQKGIVCDEIADMYDDLFNGGFIALDFLELSEMFNQ